MAESSACYGCCVKPPCCWNPYENNDFIFSFLTLEEKTILKGLVNNYNAFMALDKRSVSDDKEFTDAIHRLQQLIALRVARRVDPDIWIEP